MKPILRWTAAGAVLVALSGLMLWAFQNRHEDDDDADDKPIPSVTAKVTHNRAGETVLGLDRAAQQHLGLATSVLPAASHTQEVLAYGVLEQDPSRTFVIRAPLAGTLEMRSGENWPALGQTLADGAVIGIIRPRLAPVDRVSLEERWNTAHADAVAARANTAAAQAAYERARRLNAQDKNVSDRAVEDAQARLQGEQARLSAATANEQLLQAALRAASGPAAASPLAADRGGQVVEVLAQPGESVEAGQAVLRVARFDSLLARVDVPAGEAAPAVVRSAVLSAAGYEDRPIRAQAVAYAAAVDPRTQGQGYLFRVPDPGGRLRPGLAVTARLEQPGAAQAGVVLPEAALVHEDGQVWVFVQTADTQFTRKAVAATEPAPGGWFSTALAPGARVVTTGAQALLSEEFKSQFQMED